MLRLLAGLLILAQSTVVEADQGLQVEQVSEILAELAQAMRTNEEWSA